METIEEIKHHCPELSDSTQRRLALDIFGSYLTAGDMEGFWVLQLPYCCTDDLMEDPERIRNTSNRMYHDRHTARVIRDLPGPLDGNATIQRGATWVVSEGTPESLLVELWELLGTLEAYTVIDSADYSRRMAEEGLEWV